MTADEIMHALRLTAMGRVGAPEQQRLCEALAKLLTDPEEAMGLADGIHHLTQFDPVSPPSHAHTFSAPKRTRKAKAD